MAGNSDVVESSILYSKLSQRVDLAYLDGTIDEICRFNRAIKWRLSRFVVSPQFEPCCL